MSLHVLKKKVDDLGNTTNSNCSIYITAVSCLCCRPLGGTAVCNLGVFLRSLYLPHYFRQLFQLKKKNCCNWKHVTSCRFTNLGLWPCWTHTQWSLTSSFSVHSLLVFVQIVCHVVSPVMEVMVGRWPTPWFLFTDTDRLFSLTESTKRVRKIPFSFSIYTEVTERSIINNQHKSTFTGAQWCDLVGLHAQITAVVTQSWWISVSFVMLAPAGRGDVVRLLCCSACWETRGRRVVECGWTWRLVLNVVEYSAAWRGHGEIAPPCVSVKQM